MKKLFILLFAVFTGLLSAQPVDTYFGVQTHFGQFYRPDMDSASVTAMLDSIQAAGIKIIRDECYWSLVETTPGVYTVPPQADYYVSEALARGIDVLLILNYNNPLYAAHAGSGISTDSNRAAFKEYCVEMVSHFAPLGIKHYEIWNEPNIPIFWDPLPNAQDYALLLQEVYQPIKDVDSTVTVLGCATSPAEGNPPPFIEWLTFIQGVWNNGGNNYFDALSFHLYRVDRGPEQWLNGDVTNLRNIIGSDIDIYLTECGYHTSSVWPNLSEADQARYITRLYLIGRSIDRLMNITYYDFKNDGEDAGEHEHNFGIVHFDRQPKPAYNAYKTCIAKTENLDLINTSRSGNRYTYTFSDGSDTTYAVWNSSAPETSTMQPGGSKIRVTSMTGSTGYMYESDMEFDILFDVSPQYIERVDVFPNIESFGLTPAIDTFVVGQSFSFELTGYTLYGEEIKIDPAGANWSFSNGNASFTAPGEFKANAAGTGNIQIEFEGFQYDIPITIFEAYGSFEFEPFNTMDKFSTEFVNLLPQTQLTIIDSNYTSASHSLLIDYAFDYISLTQHRILFNCDYLLIGEPDSILIDIFNNGNAHVLKFIVEDRNGSPFEVRSPQIPSEQGWITTGVDLLPVTAVFQYPFRIKQIIFYAVEDGATVGNQYSGSVLLDNLRSTALWINDIEDEESTLPGNFLLRQNYPNPFNPSTTITYSVATEEYIDIRVYDILGNQVASLVNEIQAPGDYTLTFSASDAGYKLSTGVYLLRMQAGDFSDVKKLLLLK